MKTKITLIIALFFGLSLGFAQNEQECGTKLSLMAEAAKAGSFDSAYEPYKWLRENCPKYNLAIYQYGEKILENFIETKADKKTYIIELTELWNDRAQYFPSKTKVGDVMVDACLLKYDNKDVLGLNSQQLYDCFDNAYKTDKENFKSTKGLYVYFKLMVDLYDAGQKTDQELFDKYDDVVEKIEDEVEYNSIQLNKYLAKEEAGKALSARDAKYKKYHGQMIDAFDKVTAGVDKELGDRANCSNLIPLYTKNFEANKDNSVWLQRALNKMFQKECTDDPLFIKIVDRKYELSPDADTAYYLYLKTGEQKYLDQAISLQTDPFKKSKLVYKIALGLKKKGSFGQARQYFTEALKLNPSNKNPHMHIAEMYAKSANNCGTDSFNKRAVFWLAAQEANKAGNSSAASRYNALAPTKSEIFNKDMAGKTINIGCWIGRSVSVPKL
ncbi:tetratricopeptide repeat protein [Mesoflavibacter profundi]|uniref:Tetratricopeptide repeat protein n=1 Tax=Mesoflavibacter profundi TaxID=2708110 RepID=A0ABT4S0E9_9FLAO|nr:hypothetical protein [Mesoflavibacter profundi]MDA0177564.1 hypothetical protein [Mesoflavibacter profundi]